MKKVIAILLSLAVVFAFSSCSKPKLKTGDYVMVVNEEALGEQYTDAGDEIKGYEYKISLTQTAFRLDLNFSNVIIGTYELDGKKLTLYLSSHESEVSIQQPVSGKLVLDVVSDNTLEIADAPLNYSVNICNVTENGFQLTDEVKQMSLWPFVPGVQFKLAE